MLKTLDLFAGIGGFSFALRHLGLGETKQFVENNTFCQKVLKKNFPDIPIHMDIKDFVPKRNVDLITFGSPCQDFSSSGRQDGLTGKKSSLFFEALRIVKHSKPRGFIMENVIGIQKWQPEILAELSQVGNYSLYWFTLSVENLGGCHKRDRWFCIGINEKRSTRLFLDREKYASLMKGLLTQKQAMIAYKAGEVSNTSNIPFRIPRLHSLGNCVTPQQAGFCLALFALLSDPNY